MGVGVRIRDRLKEDMVKVAISSKGKEPGDSVDPRFGRAKWFIIADTEANSFEAVTNEQNLNAAQGAGIQSAANVARQGVKYVITGHCGPNAFKTLQSQDIKVIVDAEGTVEEVLEKFKRGELKSSRGPDVEGHWV